MSLLVPRRRPSRELLDDINLSGDEMARSLEDLDLVNRRWGGSRALEDFLIPQMKETGVRRFLLLDVGAGAGGVSWRLARGLAQAGLPASVVALDLQWRHLVAGKGADRQASGLPALAADVFALPLRDKSVDWAVSTLFFHHFSPEQNVTLLRELARVSRRGFAFLDLRRHVFPLLFVGLAGRLVFRSRISVHDGRASVRQAYTPEEARQIAISAVPGSHVQRIFPFRILISGPSR